MEGGRYEVSASYGCDPADAGGRFRLSIGGASLEGRVAPTAGRKVFERGLLGELVLTRGPAILEVSSLSVPGRELMALNRIWLRRL